MVWSVHGLRLSTPRLCLWLHGPVLACPLQVVDYDDTISVGPMDDSGAISLLQSKLGNQDNPEDLAHLAFGLGNLPLALTQAASYIRQRRPKFSVQMHLQRLEAERTSQESLSGQAE